MELERGPPKSGVSSPCVVFHLFSIMSSKLLINKNSRMEKNSQKETFPPHLHVINEMEELRDNYTRHDCWSSLATGQFSKRLQRA